MTSMPGNAEFEAAIRASFARQTMMTSMRVGIARIAPGEVDLEMPHAADFCQQNGFLHAAATAALADTANGYAALSLAPPGTDVLAVEFKINLLAPARGDSYVARGRVIRSGKTLTVCLAEVFARRNEDEALIATMLSTNIVRPAA